MNPTVKLPVSLKDVNGNDYRTALGMLRSTIGREYPDGKAGYQKRTGTAD